MFIRKPKSTLSLGRIKFLSYSPILYGLGATIATFRGEEFSPYYFIIGQITVWVVHMMTHFYNEYYDFDSDVLNEHPSPWTGGSRILPQGILNPRDSIILAIFTTLLSLSLSFLMPSPTTFLICLLAIILSWGYSAPPLSFCRRGMGELITAIVLNILTPALGFFLQKGDLVPGRTRDFLLVLLPLAIIEFVRMMVMNMPDRDCDAAVGKDTLVVKIGMEKAIKTHTWGMAVAYLCLPFIYLYSDIPPEVIGSIATTAPLGFLTTWWVHKRWHDIQQFFMVPFWASTHNALAALSALIGFLIVHPIEYFFNAETHLKIFSIYLYFAVFLYFASLGDHLPEKESETAMQRPEALAD